MTKVERRVVAALVLVALTRSLVLGLVVPPYQSSDEPWHLDYARALAAGDLPVLGETRLAPEIVDHAKREAAARRLTLYGIDDPPMSREAFQPPLAYALPAVAYRLGGNDPRRGLAAFRIVDALVGAAAVVAAYALGRRAFPGRRSAAVLAAATVTLLPSVALVTSTATNDALALLLSLAALHLVVGVARDGGSPRRLVGVGAAIGVAALAKTTALVLVVPAAVAVWSGLPGGVRRRALGVAAVAAGVLALAGPWLLRNVAAGAGPIGTAAFARFGPSPGRRIGGLGLLVAEQPTAPTAERLWPELTRTTVGSLRWSDLPLPAWLYALAVAGAAAALVATVRWLRDDATDGDRRAAAVVGAAVAASVVAVVAFAYTVDWQPSGRYLLPAVVAAAAVAGAALDRRRGAVAVAVAGLGSLLVAAVAVAVAAFGWP